MRASEKTATRSARNTPGVPLDQVADTAGIAPRRLHNALRHPETRGPCDADLVHAHSVLDSTSRARLLTHRQCPPAVRRAATTDPYQEVRDTVAGVTGWASRPAFAGSAPRASFARAFTATKTPGWETVLAADAASCPPAMLARLAGNNDSLVRNAAAHHPDTPAAALAVLAGTYSTTTRYLAASNASTPTIAADAACAAVDLDALVEIIDPDADFPPSALERLANEDSPRVRAAVAEHPNCPAPLIEQLAKDPEWWVRASVSENPEVSAETLDMLARDANSDVSYAAQQRMGWA